MEFDFEKHSTLPNLDAVPEGYRALYSEADVDGKKVFRISDQARGIVEAYVGTNKALTKSRADLKAANDESASRRVTKKAVVDMAKALGVEEVDENEPLTALKGYVEGLAEKVRGGQEVKINLAKIQQDYDKRLGEANTLSEAKLTKMQGALERYLVDQAATAALAAAKGSVDLLLPHVKKHTKVVAEGDEYVVRVIDAQGDARSNGKGGFMNVNDLVAEMKTQAAFGRAFDSETPSGTGARPGSMQQRPSKSDEPKDAISKISAGLAKGQYSKGRG